MAESKPIKREKSSFKFVGHALAGLMSHKGAFEEGAGKVILEDGKIAGIEGTIKADSVNTGIEKLDSHLKSDGFFDVEKYPKIKFKSTSLEKNQMVGDLTFRGVTKSVAFPVKITKDSISADFKLDTKPFGMKYIAIRKEVRIIFKLVI